ncbi:DUF4169 family protein [uncultured Roseobacter sp.]|uniref:DUF4169 family protein n=1 Tax=uncultured Roseobacter sp. TaxID=114847 RepID=UPI002619AC2B|nr:DUF4169 family protein [uncultured Roseobacter sp.]
MSKPVNLNRFRKDRARQERRAQADENAVRFGRSKAEKELEQSRRAQSERRIDGHRRDE